MHPKRNPSEILRVEQRDLFASSGVGQGYLTRLLKTPSPRCPDFFRPTQITLCKGAESTPDRKAFSRRLCEVFPEASVAAQPDLAHTRVNVGLPDDTAARIDAGKAHLVIGEHKSAVRFSSEDANTCPNYWHFSLYGFCPYGCAYCYLAGTQGVWFSPTVKVFVNIDDILDRIDSKARRIGEPISFYQGKLQDPLALDALTGFSRVLVPFFAEHPFAHQVILTKSADVKNLLSLDHRKKTILSWSLIPPRIADRFESDTPSVEARLRAMKKCAAAGYPVRAVLMPIIPVDGWERLHSDFVDRLLDEIPIERLTLGGTCIYPNAIQAMETRLGPANAVSRHLAPLRLTGDRRRRYALGLRAHMYNSLIRRAKLRRRDLPVAVCLEDNSIRSRLTEPVSWGHCNCVL